MKPTITALETKRRTEPRRRNPATSMKAPVRIESVNSARAGSSASWMAGTSAMTMAIAPVPWTTMNAELVNTAPEIVPTR